MAAVLPAQLVVVAVVAVEVAAAAAAAAVVAGYVRSLLLLLTDISYPIIRNVIAVWWLIAQRKPC